MVNILVTNLSQCWINDNALPSIPGAINGQFGILLFCFTVLGFWLKPIITLVNRTVGKKKIKGLIHGHSSVKSLFFFSIKTTT